MTTLCWLWISGTSSWCIVRREALKEQILEALWTLNSQTQLESFWRMCIWPHSSHYEHQDLPASLFSLKPWSNPLAQRCLNYLFGCGSAFFTASFSWGSSSWQRSVGRDMNGFWEVSSYEGPFVPVPGVFLTFGQLVGNDLPPNGMIFTCLASWVASTERRWGGNSQSSIHYEVPQGFYKILCPGRQILRILWFQLKKTNFPICGGGVSSL